MLQLLDGSSVRGQSELHHHFGQAVQTIESCKHYSSRYSVPKLSTSELTCCAGAEAKLGEGEQEASEKKGPLLGLIAGIDPLSAAS